MSCARYWHTATPLASGRILVVGGSRGSSGLASAELYDPDSNTWAPVGSMTSTRSEHTATLLPSGKVLIAGGVGGETTAELFNP
jgi:N-acetylneuraminic acid mutarotase